MVDAHVYVETALEELMESVEYWRGEVARLPTDGLRAAGTARLDRIMIVLNGMDPPYTMLQYRRVSRIEVGLGGFADWINDNM